MAADRTVPGWTLARRRRIGRPTEGVLFRRDRGRTVEVGGRRSELEAGLGRILWHRLGWRGRDFSLEPGRRLRRNRRARHPGQHLARRRRLQDDRRRQNLAQRRPRRDANHLQDCRASHESGHRVCGRARTGPRPPRGCRFHRSRHLQDDERRHHLEQSAGWTSLRRSRRSENGSIQP